MSTFMIRVRLEEATAENYNELTELMNAIGFSNKIFDRNGVGYILPPGSYQGESVQHKMEVLNMVKAQSEKLLKKLMIVVSECTYRGNAWTGLDAI